MREKHTKSSWSTIRQAYKRKSAHKDRAAGRRYEKIWNEIFNPTPPSDARRSNTEDMRYDLG